MPAFAAALVIPVYVDSVTILVRAIRNKVVKAMERSREKIKVSFNVPTDSAQSNLEEYVVVGGPWF